MILLLAIHAIGCKYNVANEVFGSKDKAKTAKRQVAPVSLHLSNYAYIEQFLAAINTLKKEEVSSCKSKLGLTDWTIDSRPLDAFEWLWLI